MTFLSSDSGSSVTDMQSLQIPWQGFRAESIAMALTTLFERSHSRR